MVSSRFEILLQNPGTGGAILTKLQFYIHG